MCAAGGVRDRNRCSATALGLNGRTALGVWEVGRHDRCQAMEWIDWVVDRSIDRSMGREQSVSRSIERPQGPCALLFLALASSSPHRSVVAGERRAKAKAPADTHKGDRRLVPSHWGRPGWAGQAIIVLIRSNDRFGGGGRAWAPCGWLGLALMALVPATLAYTRPQPVVITECLPAPRLCVNELIDPRSHASTQHIHRTAQTSALRWRDGA